MERKSVPTNLEIKLSNGDISVLGDLMTSVRSKIILKLIKDGCSEEEAEDIIQSVFLKFLRNPSYDCTKSSFLTYINILSRQKRIDEYRRKKIISKDIDTLEFLTKIVDKEEEAFFDEDNLNRIRSCMKDLPTIYFEVFDMIYFRDKKYSDVSFIFEMPIGSVKSQVSRTKVILREKIFKEIQKNSAP